MTVAVLVMAPIGADASTRPAEVSRPGSDRPVAEFLRQTLDGLRFEEVLDLAPIDSAQFRALDTAADKDATTPAQRTRQYAAKDAAQPIVQQPQIDVSVLELDDAGRIVSSGTVLMSPQYPDGVVVPVDSNFHTTAVRYREWDDTGWYTNHGQGTVDIVPAGKARLWTSWSPTRRQF